MIIQQEEQEISRGGYVKETVTSKKDGVRMLIPSPDIPEPQYSKTIIILHLDYI